MAEVGFKVGQVASSYAQKKTSKTNSTYHCGAANSESSFIGLKLGLNSQTIDLGEHGLCQESRAQDVGSGVRELL